MKKGSLTFTPLLFLTFAVANTADEKAGRVAQPYIEFGSVRIVAGMPRDQAIASLAESYSITPWKNPDGTDTWGIANRLVNEDGLHPLVGYVSFGAGKVQRVGKYWPQSGSGYDVVHTVSSILDHFRDEGISNCSTSARKENQPDRDHDIIAINCGHKGVSVDASLGHFQGQPVTGVDVYEEIAYVASVNR